MVNLTKFILLILLPVFAVSLGLWFYILAKVDHKKFLKMLDDVEKNVINKEGE